MQNPQMNIRRLHLLDGARQATGLTVVIDVFRAFSVACYAFANGAEKIRLVTNLKKAFDCKKRHPQMVLLGERAGKKVEGFDFGNSPTEIESVDFSGKTIVHTTTNGTAGVLSAVQADEVITGSFSNAAAICRYVQLRNPAEVSLVAMGFLNRERREEDELCSETIAGLLNGRQPDMEKVRRQLRRCKGARKFFIAKKHWAPQRDFELCLAANRFEFVLQARRSAKGVVELHRVNIDSLQG
jgi:2-phosphosulfolactate phosphatase